MTLSDKVVSQFFEIKLTDCNKERLLSLFMRGSVTALKQRNKETGNTITTLLAE